MRPGTVDPGEAGAGLSSEPRLRPWRGLERGPRLAHKPVHRVYTVCTPVQCTGARRTQKSSVTSPGVSGDTETIPGIFERKQ